MTCNEAVSKQSLQASAAATGLDFGEDSVRVYVVASASGGTGGGMSLDIAYAVRTVLKRLEIKNPKLIRCYRALYPT